MPNPPREDRMWAALAEIVRQTTGRNDYLGQIVNRIAFEAIRDTLPPDEQGKGTEQC